MDISKVDGEIEYRQKSKKERLKIKNITGFFQIRISYKIHRLREIK